MKHFLLFTAVLAGLYIGTLFLWKSSSRRGESALFSRTHTTVVKGVGIVCVLWGHAGLAWNFAGIQCSAFSWTVENAYGVQLAPIANVVDGDVYGIQISAVNVDWGDVWGLQLGLVDYCNSFHGVQFGGINWNNTPSHGWQVAVANANQEDFAGFMVGAVNYSLRMVGCQIGVLNIGDGDMGCQIGLINAVQRMHGVQIGAVNLICEGPLPIMVIANASF